MPRKSASRVEASRRSLRCAACGAGNQLSAEALEHGWLRCGHCQTPAPVPGRGDFVVEGPGAAVTRVVRPGSSEFETDNDFVFTLPRGVAVLVGLELLLEGALYLVSRSAPAALFEVQAAGFVALAAGFGLTILAHLTRQRLAVSDRQVDFWLLTLGHAWRHRSLPTRRFRTSSHLKGATGVELATPKGSFFIHLRGISAIRWLEREIDQAILDARAPETSERIPCPACGGPVAEEKALRDAGGIDCPHCATGLVHTEGGFALPPARVGHNFPPIEDETPCETRQQGDVQEWVTESWAHHTPYGVVCSVPLFLVLVGGTIALLAWWSWSTPHLKVLVTTFSLSLSIAMLCGIPSFFYWIFGRHVFRVGPMRFEHEVRMGPWRRTRCVPLFRLLSAEAKVEKPSASAAERKRAGGPSDVVSLALETATEKIEIDPYGFDKRTAVRAAIEALPARLTALGRQVKRVGRLGPGCGR